VVPPPMAYFKLIFDIHIHGNLKNKIKNSILGSQEFISVDKNIAIFSESELSSL
jgi:hypothetical protein